MTVVSKKGPNGELAVLGLASANDESGNTLYLSLHNWAAQYNTWLLINLTPKGVFFSFFSFLPLPQFWQNLQIDDQLSASRRVGCTTWMLLLHLLQLVLLS